jgi:hypothetical protein
MKTSNKEIKLSARLPETLGGLLADEAKRRLCSNSDVVRLALLRFLRPDGQTKSDVVGNHGGQL